MAAPGKTFATAVACLLLGACTPRPGEPVAGEPLFPDVLAVTARPEPAGTWTFEVTLSSPYDSPERYADAWRILGPGDEQLALRVLTHPHANEQPFTRSLSGVDLPEGLEHVRIQGRDLVHGWGGATVDYELTR